MEQKYYIYSINSMSSVWYLANKDDDDCTLWDGAPKEMRATLTKDEADAKIEWLKERWVFSSSRYYTEKVKE